MPVILKNEWKSGWKSLLIWALSVGGMGLICIILYKGMEIAWQIWQRVLQQWARFLMLLE